MSRIAEAMKQQKIRTGQSNGGCGPMPATVPQSWGAGCPPGQCTADQLAANLNRAFAGERYPCRELAYWLQLTADGSGDATFTGNSRVTICPTRIVFMPESGETLPVGAAMSDFEIGNQNQIVGDPLPLVTIVADAYQVIPFVTDCIKAGLPFSVTLTGLDANQVGYLALIGPTIG